MTINGAVVNNGSNYGQQNGVNLGGYLVALNPAATVNGTVFNNGYNAPSGTQNGVYIRPWF